MYFALTFYVNKIYMISHCVKFYIENALDDNGAGSGAGGAQTLSFKHISFRF